MQQASQPSNETRLPRAVLRRSAAVQQRYEASTKPADPETPPPAVAATPETPADTTANTPDANAPKTPAVEDPRHSDPTYWKHRFEAVAGRLRAREDEHKAVVAEFRQEIDRLTAEVSRLQQQAPSAAPTIDLKQFFTDEQIKNLGEEDAMAMAQAAVTAATKVAQDTVKTQIEPLMNRQRDDAEAEQKRKVAEFEEAIEEQVPNYRELDKSEGWLAWLDEEDQATGMVRQDILTSHCAKLNARAVAKMFKDYLRSAAPAVPTPPVAPSGSGANGGDTPPRAPEPGQGRPSGAEIKEMYRRRATKRPGQPGYVSDEEFAKFEARLKLPR